MIEGLDAKIQGQKTSGPDRHAHHAIELQGPEPDGTTLLTGIRVERIWSIVACF